MKKLTLLLVSVALLSGTGAMAQKACCKKGAKCSKECSKDKASKESSKTTNNQKVEGPKKSS